MPSKKLHSSKSDFCDSNKLHAVFIRHAIKICPTKVYFSAKPQYFSVHSDLHSPEQVRYSIPPNISTTGCRHLLQTPFKPSNKSQSCTSNPGTHLSRDPGLGHPRCTSLFALAHNPRARPVSRLFPARARAAHRVRPQRQSASLAGLRARQTAHLQTGSRLSRHPGCRYIPIYTSLLLASSCF